MTPVDQPLIILPSRRPGCNTGTLWFEYPSFLGIQRDPDQLSETTFLQPELKERPMWVSAWKRRCISEVAAEAGLVELEFDKEKGIVSKLGEKVDFSKFNECSIIWGKHPMNNLKFFHDVPILQRFNHIPGSRHLTRKDYISYTFGEMVTKFKDEYDFFPESYVFPKQQSLLKQRILELADRRRHLWIRKPVASSKGIGVSLVKEGDILMVLSGRTSKGRIKKKGDTSNVEYVFQRYVNNPYLINGYKFDVRLYVLVPSFQPLRVYLFESGMVRFCTEKYTQSGGSLAHLTNYSLNKYSADFDDSEDEGSGSKWSFAALMKHIKKYHGSDVATHIMTQMKDVIVKSIISGEDKIAKHYKKARSESGRNDPENTCFELFGFDLMIDDNFKVWLLEVNLSPSLSTSGSKLDRRIKTTLICDTFHLIGVPFVCDPTADRSKPNAFTSKSFDSEGLNGFYSSSIADVLTVGDHDDNDNDDDDVNVHLQLAQPSSKVDRNTATSKSGSLRMKSVRFSYNNMMKRLSSRLKLTTASKSAAKMDNLLWEQLDEKEKDSIYRVCEEYQRRGHFERLFPPVNDKKKHEYYLRFFPKTDRLYTNRLVKKFEHLVNEILRFPFPDSDANQQGICGAQLDSLTL